MNRRVLEYLDWTSRVRHTLVVFLFLAVGAQYLGYWFVAHTHAVASLDERQRFLLLGLNVALMFCAVMAGMLRSHLGPDRGYRAWLLSTPWEPGDRLPFGALRLTVFDVVFAVALTALHPVWSFNVAAAFMVGHIGAVLSESAPGHQEASTGLHFMLPAVALILLPHSWAIFLLLLLATPVAHHAVADSVARYRKAALTKGEPIDQVSPAVRSRVQAMFAHVSPEKPEEKETGWSARRLVVGLFCGLWWLAIWRVLMLAGPHVNLEDGTLEEVLTVDPWLGAKVTFAALLLAGVFRSVKYAGCGPISYWGRLWRGMFWMRGLTWPRMVSLVVTLPVIAVGVVALWIGLPAVVVLPTCVVAAMTWMTSVGPDAETWRLTSPCHAGLSGGRWLRDSEDRVARDREERESRQADRPKGQHWTEVQINVDLWPRGWKL